MISERLYKNNKNFLFLVLIMSIIFETKRLDFYCDNAIFRHFVNRSLLFVAFS